MPVFDTGLVKKWGVTVQFYASNKSIADWMKSELRTNYHPKGEELIIDWVAEWLIIRGFKNPDEEIIPFMAWIMDLLDKNGWKHDNQKDAGDPETHHFKKEETEVEKN